MIPSLRRLWPRAAAADRERPEPGATQVLMVCAGNICRSPTAEAVLRSKLHRAGLGTRVQVDSAGTHGFHAGDAPDPRAMASAARRGYNLAPLRARPVLDLDFGRFHWLLAMDEANLQWLQRKAPAEPRAQSAQLGLLMSHATRHPGVLTVPDPYYGAPAGFEHVLDLIEDACDGLVVRLKA